nr:MAG TPA: hypothetical protein [Caudoviricetes sp.]
MLTSMLYYVIIITQDNTKITLNKQKEKSI